MRWYELQPPHLINVATLPCESRNLKMWYYSGILPKKISSNVSYMLHRNEPVGYKISGVMQQSMYGPTKMLDANLCWLWTERYQGCDWPVVRQSETMYAFWRL